MTKMKIQYLFLIKVILLISVEILGILSETHDTLFFVVLNRRTKLLMTPMIELAHNLDLTLSNKCLEVIIQCKDLFLSHLMYRIFFYDHF